MKTLESIETKLLDKYHLAIDFVKTILGEDFVKEHLYLAGGALVSEILNERPKDLDLFCKSALGVSFLLEKCDFFIEQIENKSVSDSIYKKFGWISGEKGPNGYIFYSPTMKIKLNLIYKQYGTPFRVLHNFDFMHCQIYADLNTKEVTVDGITWNLITSRKLLFNDRTSSPEYSLFRCSKFLSRGFTIDDEELLVLAKTAIPVLDKNKGSSN